ncbi:MAG: phosphate signaling complex PhoU family protein, partial [Melioribacteraceae bacterium]
IAQRVKKTNEYHSLIAETQILEMGKQAREMLKNAIDSFINNNIDLANKVIDSDESVDKFNKQIFKALVLKMQNETQLIEPCAHLIVLTRHIERLADHATNIAENLVFYVNARIIAHKKKFEKWGVSDQTID